MQPVPPDVLDLAWPLTSVPGGTAGLRLPDGSATTGSHAATGGRRAGPGRAGAEPGRQPAAVTEASGALEALLAVQDLDTALTQLQHHRAHLPERAARADALGRGGRGDGHAG